MFRRFLIALLLLLPLTAGAADAPTPASAAEPRLGTDYEILPTPQPTWGKGKIEVVEVFSYVCPHCADFQPEVDAWLKKLPKDVRYEYVPGVFSQLWENFGRAYFAAKILGIQPRTHDAVFKAIHVDHVIKTGKLEDIADWYGTQGVSRDKFLATMNSMEVTAKVGQAKQFASNTGIEYTPTIIVNGKYRVNVNDRGFDGMLATTDFLLARERAQAAAAKPASTKKR